MADAFVLVAVRGETEEIARRISRGIDVNEKHQRLKYAALHGAADNGHLGVVEVLIQNGAVVNLRRTFWDDTPLHFAAASGHAPVVKFLLEHGAERDARNRLNRMPLELALEFHRDEAVKLLGDPPDAPEPAWSSLITASSIVVEWTEPDDHLVAVTDYDLAFKTIGERPKGPDGRSYLDQDVRSVPCDPGEPEPDENDPSTVFLNRVTGNSHNFQNLLPAHVYWVSVRARNLCGVSPWSCWSVVYSAPGEPAAPSKPWLTRVTALALTVSWNSGNDHGQPIGGYRVEFVRFPPNMLDDYDSPAHRARLVDPFRQPRSGSAAATARPQPTPMSSVVDPGAAAGATSGPATGLEEAVPGSAREPVVPPSASGDAQAPMPVIAEWGADLEWEVADEGVDSTTFLLHRVTPGWGYRFRITAHNKVGWGRPGPVGDLIRVPAAIALSGAGPTALTISWLRPTSAGGEVDTFQIEQQHHVDDIRDGCADHRQLHTYAEAVSGAHALLAAEERRITDAEEDDVVEVLDAQEAALTSTDEPAKVSTKSLISAGQRRELWLAAKIIELIASNRQLLAGLSDETDDGKGSEWTPVTDGTPDTSITVSGLLPGTRYRFRLRFHTAAGWSSWEDIPVSQWMRTDDTVASQPRPVLGCVVSPYAVALRWQPSRSNGSHIVAYRLQRKRLRGNGTPDDSDSDVEDSTAGVDDDWIDVWQRISVEDAQIHGADLAEHFPTAPQQPGPALGCTVSGLRPGTRHVFRVAAFNDVGMSMWSTVSAVQRTASTVPNQPPAPIPSVQSSTSITVAWVPPRSNGEAITEWVLQRLRLSRGGHPNEKLAEGGTSVDDWVTLPMIGHRVQSTRNLRKAEPVDSDDEQAEPVARQRHFTRQGMHVVHTVLVGGLYPWSSHCFRITAKNKVGASPISPASTAVQCHADLPLVPPPPIVLCESPSSLLVGWMIPHDNGAAIDMYEVQRRRRRVRRSTNRDRSRVEIENDVGEQYGNIVDTILGRPNQSRDKKASLTEFGSEEALADHLAGVKRRQKLEAAKDRNAHAELETEDDTVMIERPEDDSDSDAGAGDGELSWMPDDDWVGIGVDLDMDVGNGLPTMINVTDAKFQARDVVENTDPAVLSGIISTQKPHAHLEAYRRERREYLWWRVDRLRPGTRHQFRVRSHNVVGWGLYSRPSRLTRTPSTEPGSILPANVMPTSPFTLVIRWLAPRSNGAAVQTYQVQRRRIRGGGHPDDSDSDPEELDGGDSNWVEVQTTMGASGTDTVPEIDEIPTMEDVPGSLAAAVADPRVETAPVAEEPAPQPQSSSESGIGFAKLFGLRRRAPSPRPPPSPRKVAVLSMVKSPPGEKYRMDEAPAQVGERKPFLFGGFFAKSSAQPKIAPVAPTVPTADGPVAAWQDAPVAAGGASGESGPVVVPPLSAPAGRRSSATVVRPEESSEGPITARSASDVGRFLRVSGFRPGTRHEFRVRARNAVGWGPWSNASRICRTDPDLPFIPVTPESIAVSHSIVAVRWLPPRSNGAAIDRYEVQRMRIRKAGNQDDMPDPGDGNALAEGTSKEKETLTVADLMDQWVAACEDVGPRGVTASDVSTVLATLFGAGTSMGLTDVQGFCAGPGATLRAHEGHGVGGKRNTLVIALSEGLLPQTFHLYRVRAHNVVGWSDWSEISLVIKTKPAPPYAPGRPTCRGRTDALITMEWTEPRSNGFPVDKYELQMARGTSNNWVVLSDEIADRSFMATDLVPVALYRFRVRAHNELGWGTFSKESEVVRTMRRF